MNADRETVERITKGLMHCMWSLEWLVDEPRMVFPHGMTVNFSEAETT